MFVRKRRVIDLAAERTEVLFVRCVLARHREREQRASVISVLKGDDCGTARVLARDLNGILGRFRTGRKQQRFLR